jgi:hypothetical protein
MNCPRCGCALALADTRCLRCGAQRPDAGGVFRTSAVLVSTRRSHVVYGSVDEMPVPLRTRLIQSTSGSDAGTILIADRRGRHEIERLAGNLPATARQRLDGEKEAAPGASRWLTGRRKDVLLLAMTALLSVLCALLALAHAWK